MLLQQRVNQIVVEGIDDRKNGIVEPVTVRIVFQQNGKIKQSVAEEDLVEKISGEKLVGNFGDFIFI